MSFSKVTDWYYIQCSLCGGKNCKKEDVNKMLVGKPAIDGLNSSFVTKRIIASQRLSMRLIDKYNIVQQFQEKNVSAIFNLQESGEHPLCGDGILERTGFSYDPEFFMKNNIRYYCFPWRDLATPPNPQYVMNIMHVIESEMKRNNGGVVLVHCHAGLGRTGLVIACYLLYSQQMVSPQGAIEFVRMKRHGSIQTRSQMAFVNKFHQHLCTIRQVFINEGSSNISLKEYMERQRMYIHGIEYRECKNTPKLIHVICNRFCNILQNKCETDSYDNVKMLLSNVSTQLKNMYEAGNRLNLKEQSLVIGIDNYKNQELDIDLDMIKQQLNNDDWSYLNENCSDLSILIAIWIDFIRQIDNPIIAFSFIGSALAIYEQNQEEKLPSIQILAYRHLPDIIHIEIFKLIVHWLNRLYLIYISTSNFNKTNSTEILDVNMSNTRQNKDEEMDIILDIGSLIMLAHCTSKTIALSQIVKDVNSQSDLYELYSMMRKFCQYCLIYNHN